MPLFLPAAGMPSRSKLNHINMAVRLLFNQYYLSLGYTSSATARFRSARLRKLDFKKWIVSSSFNFRAQQRYVLRLGLIAKIRT